MSLDRLREVLGQQRHHVSAFLMLGDPNPEVSVDLAVDAVDEGVSMLELGMPFRDPCADGPAIQASCLRAQAAGVSTAEAIAVLAEIHRRRPGVPLNLLVYANLVHAPGADRFCSAVAAAGASNLLVPDLPVEEASTLRYAVEGRGMGQVSLVGPRTDAPRLARIAASSSGFLYLAGYQGVTGAAVDPGASVVPVLRRTVAAVDLPVCLGFGIASSGQVDQAFAGGARIAVVGSHLARAIADAVPDPRRIDAAAVRAGFLRALAPLLIRSTEAESSLPHHRPRT